MTVPSIFPKSHLILGTDYLTMFLRGCYSLPSCSWVFLGSESRNHVLWPHLSHGYLSPFLLVSRIIWDWAIQVLILRPLVFSQRHFLGPATLSWTQVLRERTGRPRDAPIVPCGEQGVPTCMSGGWVC